MSELVTYLAGKSEAEAKVILKRSLLKYAAESMAAELLVFIATQQKIEADRTDKSGFVAHPGQDAVQYYGTVIQSCDTQIGSRAYVLRSLIIEELGIQDEYLTLIQPFEVHGTDRYATYVFGRLEAVIKVFVDFSVQLAVPKYD